VAQQNFGQYFRSLLILFAALLAGQVFIIGILYFTTPPAPVAENDLFRFVPLVLLLLPVSGYFIAKQRIALAREKAGFIEKFELYRTAKILQWAMVEGAAFISAVLFFFASGRPEFLGFSAICLLYFVTLRPAQEKIIHDLELTAAEQARLNNPNEVVAEVPDREN
jgi:hypothetical protein